MEVIRDHNPHHQFARCALVTFTGWITVGLRKTLVTYGSEPNKIQMCNKD